MESKKKARRERPRRNIKYPRIGECAGTLGVSRTHLWYVLEGIRKGRANLAEEYYHMAGGRA